MMGRDSTRKLGYCSIGQLNGQEGQSRSSWRSWATKPLDRWQSRQTKPEAQVSAISLAVARGEVNPKQADDQQPGSATETVDDNDNHLSRNRDSLGRVTNDLRIASPNSTEASLQDVGLGHLVHLREYEIILSQDESWGKYLSAWHWLTHSEIGYGLCSADADADADPKQELESSRQPLRSLNEDVTETQLIGYATVRFILFRGLVMHR